MNPSIQPSNLQTWIDELTMAALACGRRHDKAGITVMFELSNAAAELIRLQEQVR